MLFPPGAKGVGRISRTAEGVGPIPRAAEGGRETRARVPPVHFSASAPETISMSSFVIFAWRARL